MRVGRQRLYGGAALVDEEADFRGNRDASCSTMLPAEERYDLTFEPPRPPGPSRGRLAFDNAPPAAPPSPIV